MLRVVFGIGVADERALLITRFRAQVVQVLADKMGGPDHLLRADLAIASMLGLGAMISIDREGPLKSSSIDEIVRVYAPGVQALISQ